MYAVRVIRIVSGELKGRLLAPLPRGVDGLRPSSGRVRGAIFDRLRVETPGAKLLDLFAGSGALSIEGLSRGAASATLVERNRALHRYLQRQLSSFGLEGRSRVVQGEALRFLSGPPPEAFDLVLVDPPWAEVALYGSCLEALASPGWLAPDAVIVVERSKRAVEVARWPVGYREDAMRPHGDTVLHFLSRGE